MMMEMAASDVEGGNDLSERGLAQWMREREKRSK